LEQVDKSNFDQNIEFNEREEEEEEEKQEFQPSIGVRFTREEDFEQVSKTQNSHMETEEKPVSSEIEIQKEISQFPVNEQDIFAVGDIPDILVFNYRTSIWSRIPLSDRFSDYRGHLKYSSIVLTNLKTRAFLMTGGCSKMT